MDVTWTFVNSQIWSAVEVNTAIVCSSLASLRPLFNLILYGSVDRPIASASVKSTKTRERSPQSRKSSQNSGSFFEQHCSIKHSIKSLPSKVANRISHSWPVSNPRKSRETRPSEVGVRRGSFTQLAGMSGVDTPATVSRQVSVRKASWKTQNEIMMSVLKGFEGINVHTEINVDEQTQKSKESV